MSQHKETKLISLDDNDIVTEDAHITRRSALTKVGAALAGVTALLGILPAEAEASEEATHEPTTDGPTHAPLEQRRRRRRCTDSDGGRWADPAGRGRRC